MLLVGAPAAAQNAGFDDVPPWHWAFDAVQRLGTAGIFVGYPSNDKERALNAVAQVYEAFAHSSHPAAKAWAERFLVNLPANWAQPLERSVLLSFRLENARVDMSEASAVVSFVALVTLRSGGTLASSRANVRAEVQKDSDGRMRVNYVTLAAGHPQLFR